MGSALVESTRSDSATRADLAELEVRLIKWAIGTSGSHFAHWAFPQGRVGPSIGLGLESDEHGVWA